jgi:hypothetical protein
VAIVLCLCGLQVSFYAQNATKLSPKVMAAMNAPLAELKDNDPPLIRLKKERFNAVLKEAKAWSNLYNRGLTRLPQLIDVGQRLFAAFGVSNEEWGSSAISLQFESHFDTSGADCGREPRGIIYSPKFCVDVRCPKGLIKENQAVRLPKHEIASLNGSRVCSIHGKLCS